MKENEDNVLLTSFLPPKNKMAHPKISNKRRNLGTSGRETCKAKV